MLYLPANIPTLRSHVKAQNFWDTELFLETEDSLQNLTQDILG